MLSRILSGESAKPVEWSPISAVAASQRANEVPGAQEAQSAADIERRLQTEREAAFQAGRQAGLEQARAEADILKAQLARTISDVASMKVRLRAEAEQEIVRLALAIARKILHREACVDPDAIAGVLKAALARLAQREARRALVHPADADSLRKHLSTSGLSPALQIVADNSLTPGALILETTHGSIDASMDSQLAEIERGFADLLEHR
jgi:flagellar assembly protein FliH